MRHDRSYRPRMTAPSKVECATPAISGRVVWLDILKGIGIVLVVLGHTLRGLSAAHVLSPGGAAPVVDRWIYAFHMPLFFVAAGFLLPRAASSGFRTFVTDRFARLGYPYLVWAPLQALLMTFASRYTNHPEHLSRAARAAFDPPMQFWFLYALLVQSLVFGALWKLGARRALVLALAAVAFATEPFVPLGSWSVPYQARHYFVYVAIGAFLGRREVLSAVNGASRPALVFTVVGGLGMVTAMVAAGFAPGERSLEDLVAALSGTVGTVALGRLLQDSTLRRALVYVGRRSLAIFVAHSIFSAAIRIGLQKFLRIDGAAVHLAAGVSVGLGAPLALSILAERWGFPYVFAWPSRGKDRAAAAPARSAAAST